MKVIGIDCGLTGACAVIEWELYTGNFLKNSKFVTFFDTPTFKVGSKKEYDINRMAKFLKKYSNTDTAIVIEKQIPMPFQTSQSTFKVGYGMGIWIGIVVSLGFPYTLVAPVTWKKRMLKDMAKEKDASRLRAIQLYPNTSEHLKLKKHHDRAEALLLAAYGRL